MSGLCQVKEAGARGVPESRRGTRQGDRHCSTGTVRPRVTNSAASPGLLTTRRRVGFIAHFILGNRGTAPQRLSTCTNPCLPLLRCQLGHGHLTLGDKKAQWSVLLGPRSHLGSSGQRDCAWPGHWRADLGRGSRPGRAGRACCHPDDAASRKLEQTFQVGKNSWQTCGFRKGAGPLIVTPVCPASLPGTRPPGLAGPSSSAQHRAGGDGRAAQSWK